MKRNVLKIVAVITAFFIGVSINNSCGEPETGNGGNSIKDLWNAVNSLSKEVEQLKKDNKQLQEDVKLLNEKIVALGGGNNDQVDSGETLVDGLYFSRGGSVSSKIKKFTQPNIVTEYTYDGQGRIKSYFHTISGVKTTYNYSYSGKSVSVTSGSETIQTFEYY